MRSCFAGLWSLAPDAGGAADKGTAANSKPVGARTGEQNQQGQQDRQEVEGQAAAERDAEGMGEEEWEEDEERDGNSVTLDAVKDAMERPGNYVLKPQREGGGEQTVCVS